MHWSHAPPLSENAVTTPGAAPPVNLADGDYDEAAAHASFLEAVLDFRAGKDATPAAEPEMCAVVFAVLCTSLYF